LQGKGPPARVAELDNGEVRVLSGVSVAAASAAVFDDAEGHRWFIVDGRIVDVAHPGL